MLRFYNILYQTTVDRCHVDVVTFHYWLNPPAIELIAHEAELGRWLYIYHVALLFPSIICLRERQLLFDNRATSSMFVEANLQNIV